MKQCPICRQTFADELTYCTSDGTKLRTVTQGVPTVERTTPFDTRPVPPTTAPIEQLPTRREERNSWKIAFFVLLIASIAGNGLMLYLLMNQPAARPAAPPPPAATPAPTTDAPEAPAASVPLIDMSREEILSILPKNLRRRFQSVSGAPAQPDALRVLSDGKGGEFVALIGTGRIEGTQQPAPRLMVLKREAEDFHDVTREFLPAAYQAGTIAPRGEARFDESSTAILIRDVASSRAIVVDCESCEGAFQRVMLEWRNGRYVEARRDWENTPYTAFYLAAEALEKRKVDARARSFIDESVDDRIAQGFARRGKEGWLVTPLSGDAESGRIEYQLSNGAERLTITVSRVVDTWRVIGITSE